MHCIPGVCRQITYLGCFGMCRPAPRSAHQAAVHKRYLYIFGGELTSPNQACIPFLVVA